MPPFEKGGLGGFDEKNPLLEGTPHSLQTIDSATSQATASSAFRMTTFLYDRILLNLMALG